MPRIPVLTVLVLGLRTGYAGLIVGTLYVRWRIAGAQPYENRGQAMRRRQTWIGIFVMIAMLLVSSTVPGHADRGGHGYRSHGHRGFHRSGGVRVFISPGLVVPFGSYWGPYPEPPVVVAPAPRVYVESSPPTYWYYCDAAQAYYPYVQQCPGEWRQVLPTPPG